MYGTTTRPRPAEWLLTFVLWAGLLSIALATTARMPGAPDCKLATGEYSAGFGSGDVAATPGNCASGGRSFLAAR